MQIRDFCLTKSSIETICDVAGEGKQADRQTYTALKILSYSYNRTVSK